MKINVDYLIQGFRFKKQQNGDRRRNKKKSAIILQENILRNLSDNYSKTCVQCTISESSDNLNSQLLLRWLNRSWEHHICITERH